MTATQDLIAAALALADIDEHVAEMPTQAAADVREACARAMVQPDMDEVEKLLCIHENRVRMPCEIIESDFERNTVTLKMKRSGYIVAAGPHYLVAASATPQPVEMNPNNCATCDHKQHTDGGWCYMFRDEPQEVCARRTARPRLPTNMVQPVSEVPIPEPTATFYIDEQTGRWSEYMRPPAKLTEGDARLYDGPALHAYGEQCRAAGYAAEVAACDVPEADFGNMLDCRTCAHFTADGCNSTVMCMEADQYKATGPRRYWATMSGEVKP